MAESSWISFMTPQKPQKTSELCAQVRKDSATKEAAFTGSSHSLWLRAATSQLEMALAASRYTEVNSKTKTSFTSTPDPEYSQWQMQDLTLTVLNSLSVLWPLSGLMESTWCSARSEKNACPY